MALTAPKTTDKTAAATTEEAKAPEVETQAAPEVVTEAQQEAPAVAAKPEPEVVKESVEKAVQHDAESQPPAARSSSAPAVSSGSSIEQSMAEDGLEGLSIGGMSFDRIKLPNEGVFQFGPDEEPLGKSFDAVVQSTRAIFIVRQSDDDDAENYYSYDADGAKDTNGVSKADTLQEWKEDGFDKPSIKRYLEVLLEMYDIDEEGNAGERHGLLAMASIPPASIQRISGVLMQITKMRGLHHTQAVITFMVGAKVKKGSNNFFPWTAKFKQEV